MPKPLRLQSELSLPNFIIVGAPKAGTTTVHTALGNHPDIFVSSPKEPHYFSFIEEQKPSWGMQSRDEYEALFATAPPDCPARGEASTWYLYSQTAARQIHELIPEAKIIMMLRNPVDRAYSHWSFQRQNQWDDLSFEEALEREANDRSDDGQWDTHYCSAGLYSAQIERYFDVMPRHQIHVGIFDDLVSDQAGFLRNCFEFLGVNPSAASPREPEVQNKTSWARSAALQSFTKNRTLHGLVSKVLPNAWRRSLGKSLRQFNEKRPPRMDPATRTRLKKFFRDDVRRLDNLLGLDLEARWLGPE